MKKHGHPVVKLLPTKVGQTKKRKKMVQKHKVDLSSIEDTSDEELAEEEQNVKKSRPRGPNFSKEEDQYIAAFGSSINGIISMDVLDEAARRCNITFHEKKKVRTGDGLWWHIKREQEKGNEIFEMVSIQPGSPKRSVGTRYGANHNIPEKLRQKPKGEINKAMKEPKIPKPPTAQPKLTQNTNHKKSKIPTNVGIMKIDVILRNPSTGETERFQTNKFSSIEDILFALT